MAQKSAEPDEVLIAGSSDTGRLDRFLASRFSSWSRTHLQRLIDHRYILVDNHPVSANHKLRPGQTISIYWPKGDKKVSPKTEEPLPFPIMYEDDALIVVNKPSGLVVHPAAGHQDGNTLVELLEGKLPKGNWPDEIRPGLVHRLDRDTTGVIVLAKTPETHAHLSKQFSRRQVKKMYVALVKGAVEAAQGTLECYMSRHPGKRQRFAVSGSGGRWASTRFKVEERFGQTATLLELYPLTGRTHQLRVQLASYGHPILGDHVYGTRDPQFDFIARQMLHAAYLSIKHPVTGASLEFNAPLPDDIQEAIKLIRLKP